MDSAPIESSVAFTLGSANAARMASFSLATTSGGVPAGAKAANQGISS